MNQQVPIGREVLPIPDRIPPRLVTYDANDPDTRFPPTTPLRPPAGAPNVLVVLLDDVGFGASSAFGGPCRMPTAERLASAGLRYTRFHTTALCSPTRAALLTGRNHHTVGMGGIPEIATSAPGYNSARPNTCAPLAETLRLNGYSTAQFGKCHEVPLWETSPQGPFDRWPSPGNGMEYFYGFIGGETNQWYPMLYENTIPVQPDRTPEEGYHLMEDMTDRAIGWVRSQRALMPDKPFFCYFAPGATHAPHHVPKEWADRYEGSFDQGWDRLREEIFARQKELGGIPQDCELTPRHAVIPAWEDMPAELKPFLTRQMEVYAGYLSYADHHVGRLIDAIEQLGILDDTLVYYIIGDNGASPEGTITGTFNEYITTINLRPELETPESLLAKLDELGGPTCYNHYAAGWAHALNTPYQWAKQVASHWGGTRNATIVHWPGGIQAADELRHQFHHVIDVAPTVLEAAGLPEPTVVHGVAQEPLQGTSMVYSFDDADAPERHETQYFEMVGNRGIYHKGWSAVTLHRHPVAPVSPMEQRLDDDVWELYDGSTDWTQAHDLSKELPDKLAELQRLFLIEAARYQVLPLDDRRAERFDPKIAGRPELITGSSQLLYPSMRRLGENAVLNLKNKSHSVTAEVVVPDGGAEGVIVAQGGALGGWSLYTKHGMLSYCYNLLGLQRFTITGTAPLPAGSHQIRAEFAYDGGGLGKGGTVTLYLDGQPAGNGRVDSTEAYTYSYDETTDVGRETGTTVSDDYRAPDSRFTGTIDWVRLEAGLDGHDHLIDPEHLTRIAMTRQ
jgi:arylsulfatase A-like enzyme